jgi:DNA-binding XRE family transcriptional regulator
MAKRTPPGPIRLDSDLFLRAAAVKGWQTRADLSRELDIHPTTLARMLAGTVEPSIQVAYDVAERLNVPVQVIFPRREEATSDR